MRRLSDNERSLVETNVTLVYHVAYSMMREGKLLYNSLEDAIGEGMLGLVKAAIIFDPQRGTQFSTLAVKSIRIHIVNMLQREKTQVKRRLFSLDDDVKTGGDAGASNDADWAEAIPSSDDVEKDAVDWLEEAVRSLCNERVATMLLDNANGRSINDIAEEYGISKQRVSKQICDARKHLKENLNIDDWR